jgi:hypothetical protein
MSVNGVTGASDAYSAYSAQSSVSKPATTSEETTAQAAENTGVIYEKSDQSAVDNSKAPYANPALVQQLKSDAENRFAQLQSLVEKLMLKQSGTSKNAEAGSIWDALREGKVEVDPETRAQAQKDVAEDGYWGVNQTSDRILDFAKALAGNDPKKLEEMREAFKKGYEQAEKTWGGKLPEISQQTFDAVNQKFDDLIGSLQTQT